MKKKISKDYLQDKSIDSVSRQHFPHRIRDTDYFCIFTGVLIKINDQVMGQDLHLSGPDTQPGIMLEYQVFGKHEGINQPAFCGAVGPGEDISSPDKKWDYPGQKNPQATSHDNQENTRCK